ncbi:fungal-specific transcription factor domain-containing protein [Lasiosphaeria ovina]|uniref:Fungal-specific transcription factor domain-containing protein n=1 Tax=Lasiosphaeria ovina TaxID=92902 RepID=A0AAE0KMB1_9PEZI|nr:fungal-specific transcription factor domain-containing protein [Lasiosphaeria ovina]
MKNKQKSRSGCRTCKLRRLRCDEAKPGCRNCAQKGLECPGYQQRLQWSTKHERPSAATTSGPVNFTQLVCAASESISHPGGPSFDETTSDRSDGRASRTPEFESGRSTTPSLSPAAESSSASPAADNAALVPLAGQGAVVQETADFMLFQPVVDIPSFLVEHWFKSVCASWSAQDSATNPYRLLTSSLWNTSRPVFYALQAISAASLVERLPHVMKETARAAPRLATDAIRKELVAFSTASRRKFPSELLLSLFCMSSSMCWMEARELGLQYVRQARALLRYLDGWTLDEKEQQMLDFFNGCLIYEEMLRSVVSDDEIDCENMLSWPEPPSLGPLVPAIPHAWTGVSPDLLRLFGKSVALCRRSRTRWRNNDGTSYRILEGAAKDIEEATAVEESLLAIEMIDPPEQDQMTVRARSLRDVTEAYRLSSLLQLYETFPDLITKRIPALADADRSAVWNAWVSPLALHITDILEGVPAGNLRCIQPLLCLCAGSGLRFDAKVPQGRDSRSYLLSTEPLSPVSPIPLELVATDVASDVAPDVASGVSPASSVPSATPNISENSIKISHARQSLMDRLDQLEVSLPPKPIGVAKQLLRAVWSAYDEEIGTSRRTHWLDVMSHTGLHSLFG